MPVVKTKLLNRTKNRTLVTCTFSNINKLASFYPVCTVHVTIYSTGGEISPSFEFYVVTCSYSSRPSCALLACVGCNNDRASFNGL